MAYQAKWGNQGFVIEPTKIIPLTGFSTSYTRKSDTNEDTSGTQTSNTRGMELQPINLETTYFAGAGVDPRKKIEEWKKEFGNKYPLYLNGKQFGPKLLELQSVNFDKFKFDNAGRIIQVSVSIKLIEYQAQAVAKSSTTYSSSGSSSGSYSGAMAAKPSSTDKSSKKNERKVPHNYVSLY